jgi:hypothetical protein
MARCVKLPTAPAAQLSSIRHTFYACEASIQQAYEQTWRALIADLRTVAVAMQETE